MDEEFYSFDRVLEELRSDEKELRRLVDQGHIRAFHDDTDTRYGMKFRKGDIVRFRKSETNAIFTALFLIAVVGLSGGIILGYFLSF